MSINIENANAQRVFNERYALGQREYGAGKANKGYQRDNVQDAFEEVCDAAIILGFAQERFNEHEWAAPAPDDPLAVIGAQELLSASIAAVQMAMDRLALLHQLVAHRWPEYVIDGVDRPALLAPPSVGA